MGVMGLFTYVKSNSHHCVNEIDLVKACRASKSQLEVIIDFCAVRDEIWRHLNDIWWEEFHNSYLTLPGGEYELFYRNIYKIFHQLQSIGLKLTVVFDCLKLSNEENQHVKHEYWIKKYEDNIETGLGLLQQLEEPPRTFMVDGKVSVTRMPLIASVMRKVIADLKLETLQPIGQEADFYRAQLLKERRAFAVLVNDTDYLLFDQCSVMMLQLFDQDGDLFSHANLFANQSLDPPAKVICGLVRNNALLDTLHLQRHSQLIDVTCVMGNLFSEPFVKKYQFRNDIGVPRSRGPPFESVANFVRKRGTCNVEEDPTVQRVIMTRGYSPLLSAAFKNARAYYGLTRDPLLVKDQLEAQKDDVLRFVLHPDNLARFGNFPINIIQGAFWPTFFLEDFQCISFYESMLMFFSRLFGLLHKNPESVSICVYHREFRTNRMIYHRIQPVRSADRPTIDTVIEENVMDNMLFFRDIMNLFWPKDREDALLSLLNPVNFTQAVLGYCLRLLSFINPNGGSYFSRKQLVALLMSMLTLMEYPNQPQLTANQLDEIKRIRFVPTLVQLTYFNWFQMMVTFSKDLVKFLFLEKHLKHFTTNLSFSLYLAYHTLDDRDAASLWRNDQLLMSVKRVYDIVYENNRNYLQWITHGTTMETNE